MSAGTSRALLATRNTKKLDELRRILEPVSPGVVLVGLDESFSGRDYLATGLTGAVVVVLIATAVTAARRCRTWGAGWCRSRSGASKVALSFAEVRVACLRPAASTLPPRSRSA